MTTLNHVLADGAQQPDLSRRLRVLQVSPELIVSALGRPNGPIAYEVIEGLPDDAVVVGVEVDHAIPVIRIIVQSAEYTPVPEDVPVPWAPPPTSVRYHGDAYAERLREWEQPGEADG